MSNGTPDWDELFGDAFSDDGDDSAPLSPGERLLYALGQLYRLWYRGQLPVAPCDFDIEDLARVIGVVRDVEFVSEGPLGRSFHFPTEVLLTDGRQRFPWRLLDLDDWTRATDGLDEF